MERSIQKSRVVIVTARNEADRITDTFEALRGRLPGAMLLLADDGSKDATARLAEQAGAEVFSRGRARGKGGAATFAAWSMLGPSEASHPPTFVFCDGDLGASAGELATLVKEVEGGRCDLAVGKFALKQGGGFGVAVTFARWAIRNLTGLELEAPISGQRAMRGAVLPHVVPFAHGFGMEIGMTVDAARAGYRVGEVELDLEHRATRRTLGGFLHRGRQLLAFARVWAVRRFGHRRGR